MRIDEPLFTLELSSEDFEAPKGSTVLRSASNLEDRAEHLKSRLPESSNEITLITLSRDESDHLLISNPNEANFGISLFDSPLLAQWLFSLPQPVYMDITGLSHRVWAPIVRASTNTNIDLRIIYLEPAEYLRRSFREEQRFYDLSEKFEGFKPLPGFASLETEDPRAAIFVPMLGFEGSRLEHVLIQTEPDPHQTQPIIGLPGFRPEYVFHAYQSNRRTLEKDYLFRQVRYAKANCPFEAFNTLTDIHSWTDNPRLRIAPIGTKPHALGAVLFALANPSSTELIYDNPVPARDRTQGRARVLVYAVSAFTNSPMFQSAGQLE